jgi:Protein of unknown function (DUF2924)
MARMRIGKGNLGVPISACFSPRAERAWSLKETLSKGNAAVDDALRMEIESLRKLTTKQLKKQFRDVCGEASLSSNHTHLYRRIAWRLHANASGGLNGRALQRAAQLAIEADRELPLPQSLGEASLLHPEPQQDRDRRLPPVDRSIERSYRGKQLVVTLRENGFEYNGNLYASLSSVARQITGTRWNGFQFFGLTERWQRP